MPQSNAVERGILDYYAENGFTLGGVDLFCLGRMKASKAAPLLLTKAFLFDEPLSNLDAELRVQMRIEIAKLHQQLGATMIFVTHDQVEAMTLADRNVVLRAGLGGAVDPETGGSPFARVAIVYPATAIPAEAAEKLLTSIRSQVAKNLICIRPV